MGYYLEKEELMQALAEDKEAVAECIKGKKTRI